MYIPLYNKTNYTMLSSLLKIDDLIFYAQNNNLNSISITDTNMYGVPEFIKNCNSKGIKPIIGLTLITDDFNIVYLANELFLEDGKIKDIKGNILMSTHYLIDAANIVKWFKMYTLRWANKKRVDMSNLTMNDRKSKKSSEKALF